MTLIPIMVFWALAIRGFLSKTPNLHLYLFFGMMPLGTFAVIPPALSAGLTLMGPPVIAGLMLVKSIFLRKSGLSRLCNLALLPSQLGLLFTFWYIGCWVTLFSPTYFKGRVEVVPLNVQYVGFMGTDFLEPTPQNISQTLYLTVSVFAVFLFQDLMRSAAHREVCMDALRFGAYVAAFTGMLDLAGTVIPIQPFLDLFRTANYAILTDVVIGDSKRVVGLMSEASSFGAVCLFFLCCLYFSRFTTAKKSLLRSTREFSLGISLIALIYLSMSSSVYVALVLFMVLVFAEWNYRQLLVVKRSFLKQGLWKEFVIFLTLVFVGLGVMICLPNFREQCMTRIEQQIFDKTESLSYQERNMWTKVSLQSLWETSGIGCGLGGTRASNRVVSIFSNVGVLSGILFYTFVIVTLTRRAGRDTVKRALSHAVRWSFLPVFACDVLAGTTPDFGLASAWFLGTAAAVSNASKDHPSYLLGGRAEWAMNPSTQ